MPAGVRDDQRYRLEQSTRLIELWQTRLVENKQRHFRYSAEIPNGLANKTSPLVRHIHIGCHSYSPARLHNVNFPFKVHDRIALLVAETMMLAKCLILCIPCGPSFLELYSKGISPKPRAFGMLSGRNVILKKAAFIQTLLNGTQHNKPQIHDRWQGTAVALPRIDYSQFPASQHTQ